MQQLMSFLETPRPGQAKVWTTLDEEERAAVEATLARLIAKVATAPTQVDEDKSEGKDNE